MKQFHCGDVVPGCMKSFQADSEEEIIRQVAIHAREDHGLMAIPPGLAQEVRSHIQDVRVA
jgi:predicted small metal-binding protein